MSTFNTLEEAQEFFKNDRFATNNGMKLEALTEEGCICSMDITEGHRNAYGGIMGGVIFTLGDFAFAIASNNVHKPTVALDVNISFLSSSRGTRLTATAKCVKDGRTTSVYNVMITDEFGKEIAMFIGTGYKL